MPVSTSSGKYYLVYDVCMRKIIKIEKIRCSNFIEMRIGNTWLFFKVARNSLVQLEIFLAPEERHA